MEIETVMVMERTGKVTNQANVKFVFKFGWKQGNTSKRIMRDLFGRKCNGKLNIEPCMAQFMSSEKITRI